MRILWMLLDAGMGFMGYMPCKALSGGLSGNLRTLAPALHRSLIPAQPSS